LRHGAIVFVASMIVNVCGYVYHAGTSRALGVDDYGALYALIAILPIAGIPAAVLATVIVKFAAEFRALGDEAHLHALVSRITLWLGMVSLAVLALAIVFNHPIAAFLKVPTRAVIPTAVLVGIVLLSPSLRAILQGTQDFVQYGISSIIEGVLKAVLGIAFVLAGFKLLGAVGGYALGSFCGLAYAWIVLQRRYGSAQERELHIDWRRVLQTLWGAGVLTLSTTILSYGDVLLVKHYMSSTEAGLYASVSLGGKILLFVAGFVPMVLLPKAADRSARGMNPLLIFATAVATLALFSAVGLTLFYFAPSLILRSLVGGQFLSAAHLLFGYGLAMVLLAAMSLVASYKIALHRFDFAVPFCVVTIGEIAAIALHHPTLSAVILILIIGNALGFLASLYRIHVWKTP
jgi:O-antigen/teichoic acid export membrane protein